MVQVQSSKKSRINKSVKMFINDEPITVKFDQDGIAEISDKILVEVMQIDPSLIILDKEVAFKIQEKQEISTVEISKLRQEILALKGNVGTLKITNDKLVSENNELKALIKEMDNELDKKSLLEESEKHGEEEDKLPIEESPEEELEEEYTEEIEDEIDEVEGEEEPEDEEPEKNQKFTKNQLQQFRVDDLREIAKDTNLPESDYMKLTKPKLIDYLISKC